MENIEVIAVQSPEAGTLLFDVIFHDTGNIGVAEYKDGEITISTYEELSDKELAFIISEIEKKKPHTDPSPIRKTATGRHLNLNNELRKWAEGDEDESKIEPQ